ncbi:LANO_0H10286g1_1 [Lachancea nothofagi CBS 11611]|uniref:Glutaredoxin-like protein n=1 Tax=Lachancea nothofagi CBS 11611 TaxID=1266666 RepID=A0A1G4KME5_9SACH|nr:LANO_0H10286g1_1 [Lachancea nothofagi CBS 11611]
MFRRFHSAARLANYSKVQLTLFSKTNCGLCDKAKNVVDQVMSDKQRYNGLQLTVVDIDEPQNKAWWNKYCMDVPVLHVENVEDTQSPLKIFHRLDLDQVKEKIESSK